MQVECCQSAVSEGSVLSECCQCSYRAVRVLSVWIECCQSAVSVDRVLSECCHVQVECCQSDVSAG